MIRKFAAVSLLASLAAVPVLVAAPAPATRPAAKPVSPPANPREQTGTHPDGSLAFRARIDLKTGERDGDFTAYFPGGKKVQERAQYAKGQLHGYRSTFDESGKLLADETWFNGRLVFPKSVKQIEAARAQMKSDVVTYLRANPPKLPAGSPPIEAYADALTKLRTYRYLCDVPTDVGYDDEYIDLCQHGAELMAKLNQLTHTPSRPDGVTDEFYEKGKAGCGRSNIFTSSNIVASVDAYMDDSDKSNIDRLGHRRWVLNPRMQSTGFGAGPGKFSAMYSFDGKRKDVPDYDFVCFPPRGYYKAAEFRSHFAWHASFNPNKFDVKSGSAKMAIYPLDGKLARAGGAMELNYENVDTGGFGIPNAVIVRPKAPVIKPGAMYEVVVSGLKGKKGAGGDEVSWIVAFY
ncbi:MAG TPA: hypothetical protein VF796_03375 [Humisphaera sp.]